MPTSVKRYGLESEDLETELRFRRMEGDLAKLTGTSDFGSGTSNVKRVNTVPKITGLRVVGSTPGAVTVAWTRSPVSNLKRYELDIAEDFAFTENKQTFNVASTEWTFNTVSTTGGGGDTVVYARVRARTNSGNVGVYSAVLDTTTGQAQTADIADDAVTDSKVDESVVVQLSLRGSKSGFQLSINATNPATHIDFSPGACRDALNLMAINYDSSGTKSLSPYVAGDGNGGMSVPLTADSWYWVFVVANGNSSTVDAGFDTSLTAANLTAASGLTYYRRVGAIKTDASSNIIAFTQWGDNFKWSTPIRDVKLNDPGTDQVTHTLSYVPSGLSVLADVTITFLRRYGDEFLYYAYGGAGAVLPAPDLDFHDVGVYGDQRGGSVHDRVLTNAAAEMVTRQDRSGSLSWVLIQTHGWVDTLGRNGEA